MANICYVEGRVWAPTKNKIRDFISWLGRNKMLQVEEIEEIQKLENGLYSQKFVGDCKWSIESSINNRGDGKGDLATKTKGIVVELWSQENGMGFQEHYIAENNGITTNDCKDWTEYCVDDFDSLEELNEEFGTQFTDEDIDCYGYVHIGGFDDWGEYADDVTPDLFED